MSDFKPSSLKVVELRAELSQRGLPTKGRKDELVARLTEALETEKRSGGNQQEIIAEPKPSDEQEQVVKEQSVIVSVVEDTAEMRDAVAKQSVEQLAEKSSEQVVERPTEQVFEQPAGKVAEIPTKTAIKQPSDKVSDELEEQAAEKPQERVVEKPQEHQIEETQEQLIEKPQEQLVEKPQEQLVEKPQEQLVEKPQEQLIEKPQQQVIEKPQQQVIEKPQQQVIEKPQQQVIETAQEQVAEKPQQQVIEIAQEQVGEKSQQKVIANPQEQTTEHHQAEAMDSEADSRLKRKRSDADSIQDDKRLKTDVNEEDSTESAAATALYVKGFVRPLIIKHAQELFAKYGTVKRFWMDSIKTHCYVTYETKLQANEASSHINGIKFPADTGRLLTVGELTSEQVDKLIECEQNAAEKRIKIDWEAMINKVKSGQALGSTASPNNDDGSRRFLSIGMGQITKQLAQAAEPITPPPAAAAAAAAKISPAITKPREISLDDLFRKTKALPQLYYLPNTDQEAKLKLEKLSQY